MERSHFKTAVYPMAVSGSTLSIRTLMFKGMTMVIDNWKLLAAIDGGLLFMLSAMNLYRSFIGQRAAKADEAGLGDEQDPWRIFV